MNLGSRISTLLLMAAVALLLLNSSGCLLTRLDEVEIQTEGIPSRNIAVGSIRVYSVDGGVLISGRVYPRVPGVHHAPIGHLDIIVCDVAGKPVLQGKTTYSPAPIRHKTRGGRERSTFTARLPVAPEMVQRIRVRHHPESSPQCPFPKL